MPRSHGIVDNEEARLNALRDLCLLDSPPSEAFDRITRLASRLIGAPVSTISLTDADRQWFKSRVGVDLEQIPREQAPCAYAIRGEGVFVVPDLLEDARFATSPLAQSGVRFYAGAPLFTRSGYGLGTLAVIDVAPRDLSDDERHLLKDLAGMVMTQIDVQSMIGRVDATSGYPNQHQLLEDLDDLTPASEGTTRICLMVEPVSSHHANEASRVLGAGYLQELVRNCLVSIRRIVAQRARIYQVAPKRVVLLLDPMPTAEWEILVAAIDAVFKQPVRCDNIPVALDPAIGVFAFEPGMVRPRDILRCLFSATDDARVDGRTVEIYSAIRDAAHARSFALLNDLREALEADDQFSLVYQPRVDLASGRCLGAEALLRWRHPRLGAVSPAEFIPLVESTALVRPLTEWVLDAAIGQFAAWEGRLRVPRISINISVVNLKEGDFAERLAALLARHGVSASAIELEFTENAIAQECAGLRAQLEALTAMGVSLAIDDFGTGYSSLAHLQRLPVRILKIDRSFVAALSASERDRKLVRTIIALGHDLDCRVVAEGVETVEDFRLLATWGCDEAQGYHIAHPLSPEDLGLWLADNRRPALRPVPMPATTPSRRVASN